MAPPISSRKLLSVALLSVSPSRPCLSRRDLGITAAAILSAVGPQRIALAYDSVPAVSADLAKLEEARAARAARLEANRKKLQPYLDALSAAKNADSFSQAADKLALWIIGQGQRPGRTAPRICQSVWRILIHIDVHALRRARLCAWVGCATSGPGGWSDGNAPIIPPVHFWPRQEPRGSGGVGYALGFISSSKAIHGHLLSLFPRARTDTHRRPRAHHHPTASRPTS
eukprot:scaffold8751_cov98-Isochrysis_galbana.AAC.1